MVSRDVASLAQKIEGETKSVVDKIEETKRWLVELVEAHHSRWGTRPGELLVPPVGHGEFVLDPAEVLPPGGGLPAGPGDDFFQERDRLLQPARVFRPSSTKLSKGEL